MAERLTVGVAARLSRYLQVLTQAKKMGRSSISSQDVSEYTHINATQIRREGAHCFHLSLGDRPGHEYVPF